MSVKVDVSSVNLSRGDSIIISFGGSKELAIYAMFPTKEGVTPFIVGPMNCNTKDFEVTVKGIKEKKRGLKDVF